MKRGITRIGVYVRVKDERQVLRTLDENGAFDGLTFTQEMRRYCGQSLRVVAIPNRIHISGVGVRGIADTVILEDAKCDGTSHAMCGRECYLLFKILWLDLPGDFERIEVISRDSIASTRTPLYWKTEVQPCQGDSAVLVKATQPLPAKNIRQYLQDLRSGSRKLGETLRMLLFLLNPRWDAKQPIWDLGISSPSFRSMVQMAALVLWQKGRWTFDKSWRDAIVKAKSSPIVGPASRFSEPLNLKPGEVVEVKSKAEVLSSLDSRDKRKGLRFYGCMLKDCGKRFVVLRQVRSVIDEIGGRIVKDIKNTVLLEGSTCSGISYRGCPRGCYWLWREDWLRRAK